MKIVDFHPSHRGAPQGDLLIFRLTETEAKRLKGSIIRPAVRGSIRLLEGEVTGHHHEIVMDRPISSEAEAAAIATAALALAKARASASRGMATLYEDHALARALPWLTRTDLMIGFLRVEGGPVVLRHPEHDAIRLPVGVYYCGR